MDPNKKRFTCSGCPYEATTKYIVEQHIKSKTLHKNIKTPLYIIDTPTMLCQYCYTTVKTMTRKNHMEEHLKVCTVKNTSANADIRHVQNNIQNINIQNIQNNYINIVINPYNNPSTNHLVYNENLVKNRIELFKQVYLNDQVPENHSLVYDQDSQKIKVYKNKNEYDLVEIEKLGVKVSSPLDKIQVELIRDNVADKELADKINAFIDLTYDEYETKNIPRYGVIALECKRIPIKTWYNIEKNKELKNMEQIRDLQEQEIEDLE